MGFEEEMIAQRHQIEDLELQVMKASLLTLKHVINLHKRADKFQQVLEQISLYEVEAPHLAEMARVVLEETGVSDEQTQNNQA